MGSVPGVTTFRRSYEAACWSHGRSPQGQKVPIVAAAPRFGLNFTFCWGPGNKRSCVKRSRCPVASLDQKVTGGNYLNMLQGKEFQTQPQHHRCRVPRRFPSGDPSQTRRPPPRRSRPWVPHRARGCPAASGHRPCGGAAGVVATITSVVCIAVVVPVPEAFFETAPSLNAGYL